MVATGEVYLEALYLEANLALKEKRAFKFEGAVSEEVVEELSWRDQALIDDWKHWHRPHGHETTAQRKAQIRATFEADQGNGQAAIDHIYSDQQHKAQQSIAASHQVSKRIYARLTADGKCSFLASCGHWLGIFTNFVSSDLVGNLCQIILGAGAWLTHAVSDAVNWVERKSTEIWHSITSWF